MFDIEEARGRVRDLRMSTIQSYNATAALLDACDEIERLRAERDAALAEAAKANSAYSSADLIKAAIAGTRFANEVQAIKNERDAALAERDRLITALEFYASPDPWTQNALEGNYGDYGNKAREALAAVPARDVKDDDAD